MKKTFLLLVALWTLTVEDYAATKLIISGIDGSSKIISLSDRPKVTFEENKLSINTLDVTIELDIQKVKDFKFADTASIDNIIDDTETGNEISIDGDIITIAPNKNDITIEIFNVNGVIVKSKYVESGLIETLSISDLENGIYIISTPQQAFKIIKR